MIDLKELIKSGVHFGHRKSVWSPRMAPFIWGMKNNVHLIDVSKTAFNLEKAAKFLESVLADGKQVLWVGTKKPAQSIIFSAATSLEMPYVTHRWIGGTLSNHSQVRKSVTKLLHYEDVLSKASKYPYYTKKELNVFQKVVERLKKNIGGIVSLKWPIGAIVLVDIKKEQAALREAAVMGVPVVALVDTNSDPSLVDYIVPGNDDAPRSIKFIVDYLEKAAKRGLEKAATVEKKEKVEPKGKTEKVAKVDAKEQDKGKRSVNKQDSKKAADDTPKKRTAVKKVAREKGDKQEDVAKKTAKAKVSKKTDKASSKAEVKKPKK